jgi:DNA-directed RNA polymerase specialized sigma24 family protein
MSEGVDLETVAHVATNAVYRRFARWTEREDLLQEAQLWLWEHATRVQSKIDNADTEAAAASSIRKELAGHLEKVARAYKAGASGYDPTDEDFYGAGVVALVLPKVLAGDREPPSRGLDGQPNGSADPAEGNTWLAMWLDVESALQKLDANDVHLLVDRHHQEMTYDQLSERWGWASTDTAHRNVRKAEDRLIEHLGGKRPRGCGDGCEHLGHSAALRRRPTGREETW